MKYLANSRAAATVYRQLLHSTTNARLLLKHVRFGNGWKREQEQRQRSDRSKQLIPVTPVGVLVLEPVASEIRNVAAQSLFAQIMQLDPYTARLPQLLDRAGSCTELARIGELRF